MNTNVFSSIALEILCILVLISIQRADLPIYNWILRYILPYDIQNLKVRYNPQILIQSLIIMKHPELWNWNFEIWNFDRAFQMCKHPFNNVAYYYVVVDTGINLFKWCSFIAKSMLCCIIFAAWNVREIQFRDSNKNMKYISSLK